jgi:hypothetical protein
VSDPFKLIVTSSPHQQLNLMVTIIILGDFGITLTLDPTPELAAHSSSYGTPPPSKINNERLLLLQPVARGTAAAVNTSGCQQEHMLLTKQTIQVRHSSSAMSVPPARRAGSKRPKTMEARVDLCCFCSVAAS